MSVGEPLPRDSPGLLVGERERGREREWEREPGEEEEEGDRDVPLLLLGEGMACVVSCAGTVKELRSSFGLSWYQRESV